MSEHLLNILDAARQLPPEQQRWLAESLLENIERGDTPPESPPAGEADGSRETEITRRLDEVYAREDSALDPVFLRMQTTSLEREEW
jgi:hypothetical protein